jgi:hypothetical protein
MQPGTTGTERYEVSERSISVVPHNEDAEAFKMADVGSG